MTKREFIDKNEIHFTCRRDCFTGNCTKCGEQTVKQYEINEMPVITEEEIVKPYLEKLNEHIINFPWGDTSGDFMTGVKAVCNLIDNLLTEKGAEE